MSYQWLVSFTPRQKWPNSTSRIFLRDFSFWSTESEQVLKVSVSLIAITRFLALEKEISQDST